MLNKYEYQYQFDAGVNRTQMKYFDGSTTATTSYTHNNGNQLTMRSVGGAIYPYDYDANGNMTVVYDHKEDPIREFTWNRDDRLVYVNNNGSQMQYIYDALGRRIMRLDPVLDVGTIYYYDGLTVIAEKQKVGEGNWDWKRIFTVSPGVIGNIFRISEKSGETWTDAYYHYDAIGNVVLRTNGYGSILESLDQDAYGNVKVGSQSGYHLTTKEYDSIPELYYFCNRWYDNNISKFITKSKFPPYIENKYTYASNKAINNIDPTGMKDINIVWVWGDPPLPQPTPIYNPFEDDDGDGTINILDSWPNDPQNPPINRATCPTPPSYWACVSSCVEAGNTAFPTIATHAGAVWGTIAKKPIWGYPSMVHLSWTISYCIAACTGAAENRPYGEWK